MSLEIVDSCVGCYACEPLCPNKAISAVMPIEGAIVDEYGDALNPLGSLTGIPLHLLEQMREAECRQ